MPSEHAHPHAHSHAHVHGVTTFRRLGLALGITLAFVFVEIIAGVLANSLALLTDAAHNFTDVVALGLSWYAIRLTLRPPNAAKTFGYHRAGILIALLNSTTLILIALGIFYEAYQRFLAPPQVDAPILIGAATVAFLVNAGTAWLIHRGSEDDLNMRSAFVHLAGDAISTFGAILAGIGIALTGFQFLDPLVSVFIGLLILWNAWGIVRESVDILLESTPRDVDMQTMVQDILSVEGVRGIHDVHVWSLTQKLRMLSAHLLTDDAPLSASAQVQSAVSRMVCDKYDIEHTTLQLECVDCEPLQLYCTMSQDKISATK